MSDELTDSIQSDDFRLGQDRRRQLPEGNRSISTASGSWISTALRLSFAGQNGSGKSTLLEAIAIAYGFNPEGGTKNYVFSTHDTHSELLRDAIRLSQQGIPACEKWGDFLRAGKPLQRRHQRRGIRRHRAPFCPIPPALPRRELPGAGSEQPARERPVHHGRTGGSAVPSRGSSHCRRRSAGVRKQAHSSS